MEHLIAFALTEEYAGTVDQIDADGNPHTVPKFGGGMLAVGDGDFGVASELQRGDGTITVWAADAPLVELLRAYPALEEVPIAEGADPVVVSPYERVTDEALAHLASLRGIEDASRLERDLLLAMLQEEDARQLVAVETADEATAPMPATVIPPPVPREEMNHAQLRDVAGSMGLAKGGSAEQLLERIEEHEAAQAAGTDDDPPEA